MRSDAERLSDILEAINKIGSRIADDPVIFERDDLLQVWAIHYLQVIGEAARGISQAMKETYPEVPWKQIVALRNILVHEYFGLNMHQVWTMVQRDLPTLEEQVRRIRLQIAPDSGCTG